MSHRMRRMVLVNIGTNKKTSSCLITSIDPRDGAAVVGANGVGKTTTLRLIPLFFGHLPSQIVAAGKGQEAMLRFVLPTAHSAIAFEYQRGPSEEHDVRTAVIRRRQDGSDAPEYRFFNCRFKEELFKGDDGIFLDDEQSTKAALQHKISFTQKLNGADYRSVILSLRSMNKDAFKLRRLAGDYAFGPKPLPNMDRLVAAMVKDHINFTDLIQVAVGMVQEELGSGLTPDRGNLRLKQSKGALAQWIVDREMCAQSIKLRPRSDKLSEKTNEYARQEVFLRTTRVNVRALLEHRNAEVSATITKLRDIDTQRNESRVDEKKRSEALEANLKEARQKNNATISKYEEEKQKANHFEKNDAAGWLSRLSTLPTLKFNQSVLRDQITAFDEEAGEIEKWHTECISAIELQSARECERLAQAKAKPHEQHDLLVAEIRQRAKKEARQLAEKEAIESENIANRHQELTTALISAQIQVKSPVASPENIASLTQANDRLQQHAREAKEATKIQNSLNEQCQTKKLQFDRLECVLVNAIAQVNAAKDALREAERMNAPAPGTLLAALRDHPDRQWSGNLAKVIDARLLQQQDLQPQFSSASDEGSLYGWHLDVTAVSAPDWTRDEFGKQQIAEKRTELATAEAYEKLVRADMESASKEFHDAKSKLGTQTAQVSMFEMQEEALINAKAVAAERIAAEIQKILDEANKALARLKEDEQEFEQETKGHRLAFKTAHQKIEEQSSIDENCAVKTLHTALSEIDQQILLVKEGSAARLESLRQDRIRQLEEKGIDQKKLDALKVELATCSKQVKNIEDKEALISNYQQWLEEGGQASLLNAEKEKLLVDKILIQLGEEKEEFIAECNQAEDLFDELRREMRDRKADVESEIVSLEQLDGRLKQFMPSGLVTVDLNANSSALIGQISEGLRKLEDLKKEMRDEARSIRSSLSNKDSAVKNFIDTSLNGVNEEDPVELATRLHWCQQRMGQQVILNVNLTLETILATISLFHRDIAAFESEISRFNSKLQAALSAVTQFERIKDVQIHITSNFEKVDFIRKLEVLNAYARDHRAQLTYDKTNSVPTDDIAILLQDFMSVIGGDGSLEINLASHVRLHGSVVENGSLKSFRNEAELEHVSSNGLTSIIMITLLSGLLNMIRGKEKVHVAWVTDEVGKFDGPNFIALMQLLKDNLIDVVTASPDISPLHYKRFSNRYQLDDGGIIRICVPKAAKATLEEAKA